MLNGLKRNGAFLLDRVADLRTQGHAHYPRAPERWRFYLDFATTFPFCGQSVADYFQYEFARKPLAERRPFVTALRVERVLRAFNDPRALHVFRDKAEFSRTFGDLMGRELFDPALETADALARFLESHPSIVVKPVEGLMGLGVRFLAADERADPTALHPWLRQRHAILEEAIVQHPALAELHPASVNTVRIVTVLRGSAVHLAESFMRMGCGGRCVDNRHGGGIAAPVDADTGRVTDVAIGMEGTRHARHPTTNAAIVGFIVPHWPEVLALVRTAATRVPAVRYVGWDIAVTSEGRPILVEGNNRAGFDSQAVDQVGKWELYRSLMK